MGGPKQTLGYPSRTAAIRAMRDSNMTTAQIAAKIGITPKVVQDLENSAARAKVRDASEANGRKIILPGRTIERLAPHAARRGLHPNTLAKQILETVVSEDMVDAVLDDLDAEAAQ